MSGFDKCPVAGCTADRRAGQLMCRSHWYKVPKELRDRVWQTARRMWAEDELGGSAYTAWREAADEAIAYIEQVEATAT